MTRIVDAERLKTLRDFADDVIAAECFPAFKLPSNDDSEADITKNRALMVLVAADEAGIPLIDALNRARFDEHGLTFAPDPNKMPLEDYIRSAQQYVPPVVDPAPAMAAAVAATNTLYDGARLIPNGYTTPPKPMADASIGELAYFYEEAAKKGAHLDERTVAWKMLGEKIPSQTAFELGKLTRWILSKAHQPQRKLMFQDVLTVAEARIETLSKGIPQ